MQNEFFAIIPARYASTRFPGKPLADLGGKTVIEHVYRRVSSVMGPDNVAVATDDGRIARAVEAFGGRAVITSPNHRSGTDRCFEAAARIAPDAKVIVNVQGDEPFIALGQIQSVMDAFADPKVDIASLARPFGPDACYDAIADPNTVKVVMASNGNALYFSRSPIPYVRGAEKEVWSACTPFYAHVGVYAYRTGVLAKITALPPSTLEEAESLEQLRWLQAGYTIRMAITNEPTIGIDTPSDLENAKKLLGNA